MKIAYFDCFAGISGDMTLGALIDAGLSIEDLKRELTRLELPGYEIAAHKAEKKHITGTRVNVEVTGQDKVRHYGDIVEMINSSDLHEQVKSKAVEAFTILGRAEANVHGTTIDKIHFHEVGAVDSIVDIVGTAIGLHLLGVEEVYCSKIHLGAGFVKCQHGTIPVPAPATAAILKGVPVYSTGIEAELCTPTGACLMKTFAKGYGPMPGMDIKSAGYGVGYRDLSIPNLLRVFIGEKVEEGWLKDEVAVIETNVDDVSPEIMGWTMDRLMSAGALDVYLTPVYMKKNRPGVLLTALAKPADVDALVSIVFKETATLGVRIRRMEKRMLERRWIKVETKAGPVSVKTGEWKGSVNSLAPEYDECKALAEKTGIPLREIYGEAMRKAEDKIVI